MQKVNFFKTCFGEPVQEFSWISSKVHYEDFDRRDHRVTKKVLQCYIIPGKMRITVIVEQVLGPAVFSFHCQITFFVSLAKVSML